jgi:hypothetical protein
MEDEGVDGAALPWGDHPNRMVDRVGRPRLMEWASAIRYFERAASVFPQRDREITPEQRSMLLAFCVHACQSFMEACDAALEIDKGTDPQVRDAVKNLPHRHLIDSVRNSDIHGHPIPVCVPGKRVQSIVTGLGKPMRITSRPGVAVSVMFDPHSPRPIVRRSPNKLNKGDWKPGTQTISWVCDGERLLVHDFSTSKDIELTAALHEFLIEAFNLLSLRESVAQSDQREH